MRLALDPVDIPAVQAWLEDWAAKGGIWRPTGGTWPNLRPGRDGKLSATASSPRRGAENRTRTPGMPIGRWAGPTSVPPLRAGASPA